MPDIINGAFEVFGSLFCLLSVRKLHRDRVVRGVSWAHAAFFTAWGWWNLFFYAAVGLWWSWAGGIGLVIINTFWLAQLVYYTWRERRGNYNFTALRFVPEPGAIGTTPTWPRDAEPNEFNP